MNQLNDTHVNVTLTCLVSDGLCGFHSYPPKSCCENTWVKYHMLKSALDSRNGLQGISPVWPGYYLPAMYNNQLVAWKYWDPNVEQNSIIFYIVSDASARYTWYKSCDTTAVSQSAAASLHCTIRDERQYSGRRRRRAGGSQPIAFSGSPSILWTNHQVSSHGTKKHGLKSWGEVISAFALRIIPFK